MRWLVALLWQPLPVVVIGSGLVVGMRQVHGLVRNAQRQQQNLLGAEVDGDRKQGHAQRTPKVAVDWTFFQRLLVILRICVPSLSSYEALLLLVQTALLISRTLLTDWLALVEGTCGSLLISQDLAGFEKSVLQLALVGLPAAVVNSGLNYMQKKIALTIQCRLTEHLHEQYCQNRAYYAASNLSGMKSADQRITEDLQKFCDSFSDLYRHSFKPALDVMYFSRTLSKTMGYETQFVLYSYYLIAVNVLLMISPPLSQMAAQEAALAGSLRAAHQRLVTVSEDVAYNDPPGGAAEQMILNQHLRRLVQFSGLSALQLFVHQIADGLLLRFFASACCLLAYAAPIYLRKPGMRQSHTELAREYISSMRLLQHTNRGLSDIVLVTKRMANLAGHTSRVSELLEQVHALSTEGSDHRELFQRKVSSAHAMGCLLPSADAGDKELLPPSRLPGETIRFHRVCLDSPDGVPLVRELSFEVVPGRSTMLMGQNGSGKSSLIRVMAGLWPLLAGEVTYPDKHRLFYLSQRPYLVSGTLRDQLMYPFPPRRVWQEASAKERSYFASTAGRCLPESNDFLLQAELENCLRAVELEYLLERGQAWDQVQNWQETLSGGEKQRLAMARLLFHRPAFAVLDECTSAVSADGEVKLYQELQSAGITCLSIAHRPALRAFHSQIVHFQDRNVSKHGQGWWIEEI